MARWDDVLKTRVPEHFQDRDNLREYLEVCGKVFDELTDTIKEHDVYKDYKLVPEARLGLLAKRFAFAPPAELPEAVMRGIVRDIGNIHKTRGVTASIHWVFKILSWEAEIEYAWLPDPEKYEPRLKSLFPNEYEDEDRVGKDAEYMLRVDDPYTIDQEQPITFHLDSDFVYTDLLKIGINDLMYIGMGEPYDPIPTLPVEREDIGDLDYRDFLFGNAHTEENGTYFTGRRYFEKQDSAIGWRILGEKYDPKTVNRTEHKVIATPYILVKLYGDNFEKFTQPYVGEDGVVYSYTAKETYEVARLLIDYLFHEFTRPSNVKVLLFAQGDDDVDPNDPNDPRNMRDSFAVGDDLVQGETVNNPDPDSDAFAVVDGNLSHTETPNPINTNDGEDGMQFTPDVYDQTSTQTGTYTPPVELTTTGAFFLDPSDLSTMFQDDAGTVAAVVDSPVAYMTDTINGTVFTQTVAAERPILREDALGNKYLDMNGGKTLTGTIVPTTTIFTLSCAIYSSGANGSLVAATEVGGAFVNVGLSGTRIEGDFNGEAISLALTSSFSGSYFGVATVSGDLTNGDAMIMENSTSSINPALITALPVTSPTDFVIGNTGTGNHVYGVYYCEDKDTTRLSDLSTFLSTRIS